VTKPVSRTIADLEPGDHLCCIYETDAEHRQVITPFLRQGLERGEKVMYVVDARTAETILGYLRDDGLDVAPYLARGQLAILTRDETYMRNGVFDPQGMIALLRSETAQALAEGYPALRLTGEMTWALRGLPGSEQLIEYEARLNDFFPGSRCLAICQYDRRRFDPAVLLDVLRTHPIAVIGTEVYDNLYYVPAVELLNANPAAAELRHWVRNLAERQRAQERIRQQANHLEALASELERRVTERTAELRASEARLRTIFDGAASGVALVDMAGQFLESNPALQRMLGYSGDELRRKVFTEFTHPDDAAVALDLYQELATGKRDHYRMEMRYTRKDGQLTWADLNVSLVRGNEGEPAQFAIVMAEDITERKLAQVALIRAERLAIAGRLAATLTHEINNPLQAVIGCLGLAEETRAQGGDIGQYLQVAREELRRAARIVAQLRNLHQRPQLDEGEPTDVNLLVERVLTLGRKQCEERGVEVVWNAASDLPVLTLASDQIQQVFLNLLLNALDAMPEGGQLRVSTHHTGQPAGVSVAFTDDGVGIPPDSLSQVFEPFYSTKPEGLGLGLFVSQDIVKQHGGRIEADSRVGEGTTFTVWLPA